MLVVLLDARLIARVDEEHAVPPKDPTDMYNCYLQYVSESQDNGVAILHFNKDNMTEYIKPIQSARVVINMMAEIPDNGEIDYSTGLVIIVTTEIEILNQVFKGLSRNRKANVRTKYLIVYLGKEPTDNILELAWRVFIVNIAVLRQGDSRVYTYFPYGHGECGERIRSEVLGQCQELPMAALYPPKVPNVFHGCPFRITTHGAVPAVVQPRANTGVAMIDGYENVMVNSIVERLNLSKRLNVSSLKQIKRADGKFAYWNPTNNIILNISDMCFGAYKRIDVSGRLFEATYVYGLGTLVWHAPVAGPGAQWMSVILVFHWSMWYAVLGFFLLNTFVWWIFGRTTNCWQGSYLECLLGSLLVLLNGSVPFPKRTVMRFLVASWTVCSLLVIAAYQCQFLSILLKPVYEKQITNEREIVESGVPVILELAQDTQLKIINQYYSEIIRSRAQLKKLEQYKKFVVHSKKPAVFIQPLLTTRYFGMYKSRDPKGRATVYVFKDPIYFWMMCMFFRRGHPMLDRWNELLMQFVESGLLGKLITEVDNTPSDIPEVTENVPINIRHLSSAFYILLFGYLAALLAFLFEQIVHRLKKKIETRLRRQR